MKWEYLIVYEYSDLNYFGAQGWELVAVKPWRFEFRYESGSVSSKYTLKREACVYQPTLSSEHQKTIPSIMTQETNYTNCNCTGCKNYRSEKHIPEPDPNKLYNDKVQEIAEELAKVCTGDCWPDRSEFQREADIRREMSRARAMVAKMAEEFKAGFNGVYDFTDDPDFGPIIKQQLIERGLVPAKHEE